MLIEKDKYRGMFTPGVVDRAGDPWPSSGPAYAPQPVPGYAGGGTPQNDYARPIKADSWWPELFGRGSPVLDPTIWSGPFEGLF